MVLQNGTLARPDVRPDCPGVSSKVRVRFRTFFIRARRMPPLRRDAGMREAFDRRCDSHSYIYGEAAVEDLREGCGVRAAPRRECPAMAALSPHDHTDRLATLFCHDLVILSRHGRDMAQRLSGIFPVRCLAVLLILALAGPFAAVMPAPARAQQQGEA